MGSKRSHLWVWRAIDPESKLLLAIETGGRTLEMAQRVGHQVAQRLTPHYAPLYLSDGFKGYLPAILRHFGTGFTLSVTQTKDRGPSYGGCLLPRFTKSDQEPHHGGDRSTREC